MSGTTCISSGLQSASTSIYTGRGTLNAVTVISDGTNAATVTIYDNAIAASGNVLSVVTISGGMDGQTVAWNLAVRCLNGLYCSVAGTGCQAIVYYGA